MEMTVTDIRPYGKGRSAIYLNDMFAFVLYKGELSQYGLETGVVVDDELYGRILDEVLIKRARKRGMNLLKSMDRTEADLRRRLSDGGYPPEAVDDAISYLLSYHYIDDKRYASEYIRCRIGSMSIRMIRTKLSQKGIDTKVIDEAFAEHENESGNTAEDNERELIVSLIKKRCPLGVEELEYADKQRLFGYLYGKGFSVGSIESAYNSVLRSGLHNSAFT